MNQVIIEGSPILFWASIALAGIAAFIVARMIFLDEDKFKAAETLDDAEVEEKKENHGLILKYSKPFFKRYFVPIVEGMKNKKYIREKYKRKLANAGLTKEFTTDEFFAFKLFLILGFPIFYLGMNQILEMGYPVSYAPILGIFGFFYPDIWLSGKIANRKGDVIKSMPFIVDLLALSVEAGLDFVAAMNKVIDKAPPSALSDEFEILIKEIKIGSSRAEALRQLSWRIDVLQVSSFTATLIAADSVGASIGPILKTLSAEMRQKKSALIEKKAAETATKILLPLVMFIIPAVFMMIFGPVVIQFMGAQ
jgi:tight adherence protein C